MKFDTVPIRNWFGYSRRERRSSFILLILILFVISVRFLYPEKNISLENIPVEYKDDFPIHGSADSLPVQAADDTATFRTSHGPAIREKKKPLINLNSCDTTELIRLPGIGPVLSVRIVKYRKLLGGFFDVGQLREVYGLPVETFDKIKDRLFVDTLLIATINVNSADFKTLIRFPYFDKQEVTSILRYLETEGSIKNVSELVENNIITAEKAVKLRPYLRFE